MAIKVTKTGGARLTKAQLRRGQAGVEGLMNASREEMRDLVREAFALAGPEIVAELFAKLDEIEGPAAERPLVTSEYFADGACNLSIDFARLSRLSASLSPEAWRLMTMACLPASMWCAIHRQGPIRQLFDA
jgi:hypothetical protein